MVAVFCRFFQNEQDKRGSGARNGHCTGRRYLVPFSMAESLLFSMIFGVIGMAYFMYGKQNARLYPLIFGMALCIYPYFVSDLTVMIAIGVGLTLAPWFLRSDS